jgi:archaellum biogenesis ATPase FlaH
MSDALELWQHLFEGLTGWLCVTTGKRGSNGKLQAMQDYYCLWPDESDMAVLVAEDQSRKGKEVFFVASLLKAKDRHKESAAEMQALFVDCDTVGAEVPNYLLPPTATVESSPGKHHWYWKLQVPWKPEDIEALNKRLAYAISADLSGYDATQLLRVPGTKNYKYTGNPTVRLTDLDENEKYAYGEITKALPELPEVQQVSFDANEPPVSLSNEALRVWSGEKPQLKPDGSVDKSGSLCKIAYALRQAGCSVKVIAEALADRDSSLGYNKYVGRNDAAQRYQEIAVRAAQYVEPATKPLHTETALAGDFEQSGIQITSYTRLDLQSLLEPEQETEALVHGLLYPGLMTLLGSWVGIGKTSLSMAIIAGLITKQPVLGLLPPGELTGPVVYFSELSKKAMAKTLKAAAFTYDVSLDTLADNLQIYNIDGIGINDAATAKQALYICKDASLVVVDTFDAFLAGNPNDTGTVLSAWNLLKNIASNGSAVFVLDHQGKNKPDQSKEQTAVGGNAAKQRFGDMVYRLDRSDGPDRFNILSPVKDRFGEAIQLEIRKNDKGRLIAYANR